ncbi:AcrB/AcrD/AcrF family protein [Ruminococcaceae bacterium YRB3002]|nr:AcrB/AcrD/AcrF family protein [Ruminococcaceae bacterium YRB3002]
MERLSVKKPFTILVAAIIIIAMGAVSLTHLQMDLLPEMSLPYLIIVTLYPGASPEKVEDQVTGPLENALGTISGVENVLSTSSENYSMIQLEFADGTDMNTAMVRVSSAINQIESNLPDSAMTPNIMEISMDMLATMYVAVEREGYDIYQLSDFVDYDVIPAISRQDGVASISTIGLVERSVQVELNQEKIDELNDRILAKTDEQLAEAQDKLDEAKDKLNEAQELLDESQSNFGSTMSSALFSQLDKQAPGIARSLKSTINNIKSRLEDLRDQMAGLPDAAEARVQEAQKAVDAARPVLDAANEALASATSDLNEAREAMESAQQDMDEYLADPDADTSSDEYKQLEENLNNAIAAHEAASDAYSEAVTAQQAASDSYRAAMDELTAANLAASGVDEARIAAIVATIDGMIDALEAIGVNIDGSSFNNLISTTRRITSVISGISALIEQIRAMDPTGSMSSMLDSLSSRLNDLSKMADNIPQMLNGLESAFTGLTQGQLDAAVGFSTAAVQLSDAQAQLDSAQAQYDAAKKTALENANADTLITPSTLSQLIYAQNFSMPIGYIDDKDDNSWLLRVGEEFTDSEQIASALLIDNELIGTVRLEDIADIQIIDDSGKSYGKLNGNDTIILCIYKSSSSGTNDVSKNCNAAIEDLCERYPGMNAVNLVDQGDYIRMIVESVFQSMIIGAILAIVILAIFLRAIKPTIVVAISIPLSVLLAIVLMYFTGLQLNMITLSGLSLGIGMLVDNSVVVMENIFRLRGLGLPAPRAAVQGAKQVRGAIIASTLTTICVFLPGVFASGTVRTLMYPMAMSIGYCLVASLGIALTVVPASSSTLMRKTMPKEHKIMDKIQAAYGKSLRWCLRFKVVPLLVTISLLAFSVWQVFRMGIVYIPEMITNEVQINIKTPKEYTREESYAEVDAIINKIIAVDGVENVGAMDSTSTLSFFGGGLGNSSDSWGSYTVSVLLAEGAPAEQVKAVGKVIEEDMAEFPGEIEVQASQMMDSSMLGGGSGFSVKIFGDDYKELERISGEVREIFEAQEGFEDVSDNFQSGADTLQVVIDRDKAMSYGLTVAQIYAGILSHTSQSVNSTSITVNGTEMKVVVVDNTDTITKETLMDVEFEEVDMTGAAASAGMSGSTGSGMSSLDQMASMMSGEDNKEDDDADDKNEEEEENKTHKLSEFAEVIETKTTNSLRRENLTHYVTVSASIAEGYNATLLARDVEPKVNEYSETLPHGYSIEVTGESTQVMEMVTQMLELAALAMLFIYLIMVAQFQSLLSPFIIMFTIPLAFTGGMLGLLATNNPLSMLSILGFVILMGTVVNNGIVFVDYANQLRIGGMERWDALVATGKTRMRPILMTALTTILAMSMMMFGTGMATQLGRGMAVVIAAGLLYATFMTLYIVPVMYDILFKRKPLNVDVGDDMDEAIDDAAQFLKEMEEQEEKEAADAGTDTEGTAEGSGSGETPAGPGRPGSSSGET